MWNRNGVGGRCVVISLDLDLVQVNGFVSALKWLPNCRVERIVRLINIIIVIVMPFVYWLKTCHICILKTPPQYPKQFSEHLPQQYALINGLFHNYFVFQMDFAISWCHLKIDKWECHKTVIRYGFVDIPHSYCVSVCVCVRGN